MRTLFGVSLLRLPQGYRELTAARIDVGIHTGIASFFTFQDGLSWHIHALHCYLVHDIVLNFDDDGNLRTAKSIQKVMKSEARLVLLARYTTYPV